MKVHKEKWNHKMNHYRNGLPIPRIYHKKAQDKKDARYLIKCGDCNESVEIYYGPAENGLEINGVLASKKDWRKILLPLLRKN